jgi:hypothetical protein
MARHIDPTTPTVPVQRDHVQQRHTIAALVYFAYGVFYLFGAQYLTSMEATRRGMSNPTLFFVLGGVIAILFPWLIYRRFAIPLPYYWQPRTRRTTLRIDFTLLLGFLVLLRVLALVRGGVFMKTWVHTAALAVAAINATCLIWAGLSRPVWVTRAAGESP